MNAEKPKPPPTRGHWPDVAKHWAQVGAPLRPSAQDIAFFTAAIQKHPPNVRALILGVTPELYHLNWPSAAAVLAVDHTRAMIDSVWPPAPRAVVCAEWTDLPLKSASVDLLLCDGGFQLLSHPIAQTRLIQSLHRLLAPDGHCVFRLFVPPARQETAEAVLEDLLASKIPNLNILKLRLGMAMQESPEQGVQLADIWNQIHRAAPDFPALAARLAWSLDHLQAINTYRDCPKRYHFLGTDAVCEMFCHNPGGFAVERLDVPDYEWGERCPTVVFRRT